ncbi:uncharacterized protein SPAPADRAFT_47736 [Spathaspora passalidarum NRRL Y-27907]|uniref:Telomeric single stranded DNA binding POT1/Cdc13 domain-containing protein n=1 Tax=Spathaspora passalidarum (strain NRRL Y-27907 / 11-Y1) TaxID=619300 RepID=G3AGX3_SPAPN|nr:uncharacterized protein SPAPADRAFT_47736 [Spathaspora passalidarum NRRL Y-27907]EGW34646.1 hypothetical protein SPAPADRAFT_47736 [Spathaspora passalidarum NRRL Y-27907]
MDLKRVCDLPPAYYPNEFVCVLALRAQRFHKGSTCILYVTDFTENKILSNARFAVEYGFGKFYVPKGFVMRLVIFPDKLAILESKYKEVYGQELGLLSFLYSNDNDLREISLLDKLLVFTTEVCFVQKGGNLEWKSYQHKPVNKDDERKEVIDLLYNMTYKVPSNVFLENMPVAKEIIPSLLLKTILHEINFSQETEKLLDVPDFYQSTQLQQPENEIGSMEFDEGQSNYQRFTTIVETQRQHQCHENTISIHDEEDSYSDLFANRENDDDDDDDVGSLSPRIMSTSERNSRQPVFQIYQLLSLDNKIDNQIYIVNAKVIDTSPSNWSLLCGKKYTGKNGKPKVSDLVPLDLELTLVDAASNDKVITRANSLTVYLTGRSVMELLGVHAKEEMQIDATSLHKKFIKCTSKAHMLELCKQNMKISEGEMSIVIWTILNPGVFGL